MQQKKGIFGHVYAGDGVTETQARSALHFHLILFGGLNPRLLQNVAGLDDLCIEVANALDSMYTAELPRTVHVADMIEKRLPRKDKKYIPPLLET